jgi:MYXO-CTERM domain-containing protein
MFDWAATRRSCRPRRPRRPHLLALLALPCALLLVASSARAQQGKILDQQVDAAGEGYTVVKLWGNHYQMGYAQGQLLAAEIVQGVQEVQKTLGALYLVARSGMAGTLWPAKGIESELDGMVAGVKAKLPGAQLDKLDLKVINTYGDWAYTFACRSHSAWGKWVSGTTRTLSTRRLDYSVPTTLKSVRHHVLVARDPTDAKVRWVNLAWPGYVVSVTGVNEFGTLASLHDYQSKMTVGPYLPRTVAVRHALTLVEGKPVTQHLDAVWQELSKTPILTSTFINYYVPEGLGGVLTCLTAKPCSKLRKPMVAYFGGEVLLTTNQETDGKTKPPDDSFMHAYYQKGGKKTLADHYNLMGHNGMHLLSVAYRKVGDMTIWFEGEKTQGVTPKITLEFKQLFANTPAAPDGGTPPPPADGGSPGADTGTPVADAAAPGLEAGAPADGGASKADASVAVDASADSSGSPAPSDDGGCVIAVAGDMHASTTLALLGLLALFALRRRAR